MSAGHDFPAAARTALADARLQTALAHLKEGFQVKRAQAFAALEDPEALRESGRAIKAHALSRLDELLLQFESRVHAAGGKVHWARDAGEARSVIGTILKQSGAKKVTKGKSMVAEEIALNAYLEGEGFAPIETDLGEYIIQLRKEPPSHIVAPAFHLRRADVEESFRAAHVALDAGRTLDGRAALVAEARAILREHFVTGDAGITGANFLVAESGTAIIVTNEGNGDLTRLLPRTHIVLTGIEKVVPTLADAAVLLRLLTRSATGQEITSYVSFASGPRRGEDADGPAAFHVVLLDNGRSALLNSPVGEVLGCIRCGACLNHCPVYGAIGGHAYGAVYPGPIGAALNPGLAGMVATHHLADASSFCGRCEEVCPVKIPLTRIMRFWRSEAFAAGLPPTGFVRGLKWWAHVARHPLLYRVGTGIASRLLRSAGVRRRLARVASLRGWFAYRDLPAPPGKTFQQQWRARRGRA
jgi:L-lactate dehydrogenase complex protein LldF